MASQQKGLVVMCITDAEQTICRHQDRHSAFSSAFLGKDKPEDTSSQPGGGLCIKCFLTSLLVPQSGLLKPWTDSFPSCLLQAMQPCMNRSAPQRQEDIPELHPV